MKDAKVHILHTYDQEEPGTSTHMISPRRLATTSPEEGSFRDSHNVGIEAHSIRHSDIRTDRQPGYDPRPLFLLSSPGLLLSHYSLLSLLRCFVINL